MKIVQLLEDTHDAKAELVDAVSKLLPIAMEVLELKNLPDMAWVVDVDSDDQPTFGKYNHVENHLTVGIANRHPNDILRTLAHELAHFKQNQVTQLDAHSGDTGSPIENEAHALAGIIMRHFNKKYPQFLSSKPLML